MRGEFFVRIGFVFVALFLFSFVSAAISSTGVDVTVSGCNFNAGAGTLRIPLDTCSDVVGYVGSFYCGSSESDAWYTNQYNLGCARGYANFTDYLDHVSQSLGPCCPQGESCIYNTTLFVSRCEISPVVCNSSMNKVDCGDSQGTWIDMGDGPSCYCFIPETVCGDYKNQTLCEDDPLDAANYNSILQTFECNGTDFIRTGTRCYWDSVRCVEEDMFKQEIHDNITYKEFSCSSLFTLGDCVDGNQDVNWTSTSEEIHGMPDGVPEDCITAADCNNGTDERFCGAPIVKLPGFSLAGLFISLFIVGLYYLLLVRFKYFGEFKLL